MTDRQPHAYAYPEHVDWKDTGCSVAPKCLECPLPHCRYDGAVGQKALVAWRRAQQS